MPQRIDRNALVRRAADAAEDGGEEERQGKSRGAEDGLTRRSEEEAEHLAVVGGGGGDGEGEIEGERGGAHRRDVDANVAGTLLGDAGGDRLTIDGAFDIALADAITASRDRLPNALGAGTAQ